MPSVIVTLLATGSGWLSRVNDPVWIRVPRRLIRVKRAPSSERSRDSGHSERERFRILIHLLEKLQEHVRAHVEMSPLSRQQY